MYKDTKFLSFASVNIPLSILKTVSLFLLISFEECARLLAIEFIETNQVLGLALACRSSGVGLPARGTLYLAMVLHCGTATDGEGASAA